MVLGTLTRIHDPTLLHLHKGRQTRDKSRVVVAETLRLGAETLIRAAAARGAIVRFRPNADTRPSSGFHAIETHGIRRRAEEALFERHED